MKKLLFLLTILSFAINANSQTLVISIEDFNTIRVNSFWKPLELPNVIANPPTFKMVSIDNLANLQIAGNVRCNQFECQMQFANLDQSKEYILTAEYNGQKFWGVYKLDAKVIQSKDVDKKRKEIRVVANAPINVDNKSNVAVTKVEKEISNNSYFLTDPTNPSTIKINRTKLVTKNAGVSVANDITIPLEKKFNENFVSTASVSGLNYQNGQPLVAKGSIEIAGLAALPDAPKTQISLASIAAEKQKPVFELTGTVAFRKPKFATLLGRYSLCKNITKEQQENARKNLPDNEFYKEFFDDCNSNKTDTNKFLTGDFVSGEDDSNLKDVTPNFFAGIEPSVSFDIGFNSTKSKNSITVNIPFVYYYNISRRKDVSADIDALVNGGAMGTPLKVYGSWKNTPWYRLADVKFSFGPKVELFQKYRPRNLLASLRADFEFHRWLGNIAGRRNLILADLNPTGNPANRNKVLGQIRNLNFGWKLVPYLGIDAGKHLTDEKVEKTLKGVKQSVVIPRYNIARFSSGAVGIIELLIKQRYVAFSFDYSVNYLASKETGSFNTDTRLFVKDINGIHPFFKTSFEFSLDPAKRFLFKTTYENGRSLPSLEYLNKVTTGITIIR